ncbi:MAG TPA: hypothetical protein VGR71_11830 [Nitrospira sp.]|nr:hypothetical protein [Nitrospira sp.]
MRQAGKGGRRSPSNGRAIRFRDIATGVIPASPPYVDYLLHLGGQWQMLGNNAAGNCVAVTWANERRLVTATLTNQTNYPSQDQVWQFYKTQNSNFDPNGSSATNGPGSSADNGMDIQTGLNELHQNGGPDGVKLVAFAKVDLGNVAEVRAAVASCGSLWTGVFVYQNNQDEFGAEQPWDFDSSSPQDGGHSVLTGGYGVAPQGITQLQGDEKFITWAEETSFTDNYWTHAVEEGWVCIWPEHLGTSSFEQGVSGPALASVYQQVTGSQLVLP